MSDAIVHVVLAAFNDEMEKIAGWRRLDRIAVSAVKKTRGMNLAVDGVERTHPQLAAAFERSMRQVGRREARHNVTHGAGSYLARHAPPGMEPEGLTAVKQFARGANFPGALAKTAAPNPMGVLGSLSRAASRFGRNVAKRAEGLTLGEGKLLYRFAEGAQPTFGDHVRQVAASGANIVAKHPGKVLAGVAAAPVAGFAAGRLSKD